MSTSFDPSPLAGRIAADAEIRDRDLGFGSVIGHESSQVVAVDAGRLLEIERF